MHYTKSDNVDHLLGLNHNARSIICWTLSCNAVSRVVEHDAVPLEARAEAARRCRQAGYHVRFRFSPIFPLHNWREEYRHCIELLFSKVKPDVVSLLTLSGLPDYDDIARLFDRRLLDPEYLQAADEARDEMNGKVYGPLPHWVREEIYGFMIDEIRRVSPDTPVAICLETPEMWEALGHKLGQTLDDYVCCCGPDATPDHPKLASVSRCPPEECDPTTS
jgi:spore photoproduct lyase